MRKPVLYVLLILAMMLLVGTCISESYRSESTVIIEKTPAGKDIVDTAMAAGNFKTQMMAMQLAGLVDTLKSKGPFTVFAPTDEAVDKISKNQQMALLTDKTKLTSVLAYHVVTGEVTYLDLKNRTSIGTLQGERLNISVTNGNVMINNASIVRANIRCTNGIIHVIDTVLMPNGAWTAPLLVDR